MSQTYSIACHDCSVMLWIGQANTASRVNPDTNQRTPGIYTGEPETMKSLAKFFGLHVGHRLGFDIDFAFMGRDGLEEGCLPEGTGYKKLDAQTYGKD